MDDDSELESDSSDTDDNNLMAEATGEHLQEDERLMAEMNVMTPDKAEMLESLVRMGFGEEDCVFAVANNVGHNSCIDYLQRKCSICRRSQSTNKMFGSFRCQHMLCSECACEHFANVVSEPSKVDLREAACPVCRLPKSNDVASFREYLNDIGVALNTLLTKSEYETFCKERSKFAVASPSVGPESSTARAENATKDTLVRELQKLDFSLKEAQLAADCCDTLDACLVFLRQECEICLETVNAQDVVQMLNCVHSCCRNCAKRHFTIKITERNVTELVCMACNKPDILNDDREAVTEYFSNMDIMLKSIVDKETHELFNRKLRDWALNKEGNFRWCGRCDFGFIIDVQMMNTICPKCNYTSCSDCKKPWENQHARMSCAEFANWKSIVVPKYQKEELTDYLTEHGIECPKCHNKYDLAKGGCLHFVCSQCRHEFCCGCGSPFYRGSVRDPTELWGPMKACMLSVEASWNCSSSATCKSMGIHAHHPRNCSFYLRDMDHEVLEQLLKTHSIGFGNMTQVLDSQCPVMVQKEGEQKDRMCGDQSVNRNGETRCRVHYVEYLCELIKRHKLDPVSVWDVADLNKELYKHGCLALPRVSYENDAQYRLRLITFVKKRIPL